jgi:multidrug efflux pump subunit AcrA (membrane-fusion protein)
MASFHGSLRPALCALGILFTACFASGCRRAAEEPAEVAIAPVQAQQPREVSVESWTELVGTTQALPGNAARISAPVEGRVLWVLGDGHGPAVIEGQQVNVGQVIAQLDDRVMRANRARTAAVQRELEQARRQAELAVRSAQIEVDRQEELARESAGRSSLPLTSRIAREQAHIALEAARSKQQGIADKIASGLEELKALDEQLQLYTLGAPIAGRLGTVQVVPGQTLPVGTPVADVVNLNEVDVLCYVPPVVARKLLEAQNKLSKAEANKGLQARLAVDKESGRKDLAGMQGRVVYLAVGAQPDTGNFAVKVRFPNPDLALRANTVQRVAVLTQPAVVAQVIPEAALMDDQNPPGVVIIEGLETKKNAETGKEEQKGKARRMQAIVGIRDRRLGVVQILRLEDPEKKVSISLQDEPWFVTKGKNGLETGDQVKIAQEEEE